PSLIAMSAAYHGEPVPSITCPLRITMSYGGADAAFAADANRPKAIKRHRRVIGCMEILVSIPGWNLLQNSRKNFLLVIPDAAQRLPQAFAASGCIARMLRICGLARQHSAIAVRARPAMPNSAVSEITFSSAPAAAAESGPSPMKLNIRMLMVRPIIACETRCWIHVKIAIITIPPRSPVQNNSPAPKYV